MCRRFLLASSLVTIEKRFGVLASVRTARNPSMLITPGEETLIITRLKPKELIFSKFGMTSTKTWWLSVLTGILCAFAANGAYTYQIIQAILTFFKAQIKNE
jgi:hypothetical protein